MKGRKRLPDHKVAIADELHRLGVKSNRIAEYIGVHPNTIRPALNRQGPYRGLPRQLPWGTDSLANQIRNVRYQLTR